MNLNQLRTIDVPMSATVRFIENGTRKTYGSASISYPESFRGDHNVAAFTLEEHAYNEFTWGSMLSDLESLMGSEFEWPGSPNRSYFFEEDTEIAFVTHARSSDGKLVGWYYDGKDVIFILENDM